MTKYKIWNTQTDKLMIIESEGKLLDVLKELGLKEAKAKKEESKEESMKKAK